MHRIAIVGVGLIGGSLGLALRRVHPELEVIGIVRDQGKASAALERGAVSRASAELQDARHSDLVVIATPIPEIRDVLSRLGGILDQATLVTDVASVKSTVLAWASSVLPRPARFLGGHPMAGKAESGLTSADSGLFAEAPWIFTAQPGQSLDPFGPWFDLVRSIGGHPVFMTAEDHDRDAALVSHLAFTISCAYAASVHSAPNAIQALSTAGPGFRDMVRLAAGDPSLYRAIAQANRGPLLDAIDRFTAVLSSYRQRIEADQEWARP